MSAKDHCGHHREHHRHKFYHHITTFIITIIIIIILLIILLIYLILHPSKPTFTLQDVTVFAFNTTTTITTTTTTITTTFQTTISSHNPNSLIGIYYDKLEVYATYRNQRITLPTMIPPMYQGHKEVNVWSPYLYGTRVPLAPSLAVSLAEDETARTVLVDVRGGGRVRWKVGSFVSGGYRLKVNCPVYIKFGGYNGGYTVDPAVKYQLVQGCNVDV